MVNFLQPILLPGEEDRGLPLLRESPLSLDPTSPPRLTPPSFQSSLEGKRGDGIMPMTSKYKIFSQGWHSPFLQCSPHTYNGR